MTKLLQVLVRLTADQRRTVRKRKRCPTLRCPLIKNASCDRLSSCLPQSRGAVAATASGSGGGFSRCVPERGSGARPVSDSIFLCAAFREGGAVVLTKQNTHMMLDNDFLEDVDEEADSEDEYDNIQNGTILEGDEENEMAEATMPTVAATAAVSEDDKTPQAETVPHPLHEQSRESQSSMVDDVSSR